MRVAPIALVGTSSEFYIDLDFARFGFSYLRTAPAASWVEGGANRRNPALSGPMTPRTAGWAQVTLRVWHIRLLVVSKALAGRLCHAKIQAVLFPDGIPGVELNATMDFLDISSCLGGVHALSGGGPCLLQRPTLRSSLQHAGAVAS